MRLHRYCTFLNENKELAIKNYLNQDEISQETFDEILELTGGDNWTNLVTSYVVGDYLEIDVYFDRPSPKEFYKFLKDYKDDLFPIEGFNYLQIEGMEEFVYALTIRREILDLFKELPPEALRNIKEDKQKRRDYEKMEVYFEDLKNFCEEYNEKIKSKSQEFRSVMNKKLFKSGTTLDDLISFLDNNQNLLGDVEFTRERLNQLIQRDDIEKVYEKGNFVIVRVSSHKAMIEIGTNSLWCFAYDTKESEKYWEEYSGGTRFEELGNFDVNYGNVYVIFDFRKKSNSPNFMFAVLTTKSKNKKEKEKAVTAFNMLNEYDKKHEVIMISHKTHDELLLHTAEGYRDPDEYSQENFFKKIFGKDWEKLIWEIFKFG